MHAYINGNIMLLGHYSTGCGVLSNWTSWSSCSTSCGSGLKFRTRTCIKNQETDKDCYGERSQDEHCSLSPCRGTNVCDMPHSFAYIHTVTIRKM